MIGPARQRAGTAGATRLLSRALRIGCLALLAACAGPACANQGFYFTFTNGSAWPMVVDFDTVKGAVNWERYNFQGRVPVPPHTTTAPLYTESAFNLLNDLTLGSTYISFMIYPEGDARHADTLIMISKQGALVSACTTANTTVRQNLTYGWINAWPKPDSAQGKQNFCNVYHGQRTVDRAGHRFMDTIARDRTSSQILVNVAYEPRGDGCSLPRARYHFHVSVAHDDSFYHDFELSSISGDDPNGGSR